MWTAGQGAGGAEGRACQAAVRRGPGATQPPPSTPAATPLTSIVGASQHVVGPCSQGSGRISQPPTACICAPPACHPGGCQQGGLAHPTWARWCAGPCRPPRSSWRSGCRASRPGRTARRSWRARRSTSAGGWAGGMCGHRKARGPHGGDPVVSECPVPPSPQPPAHVGGVVGLVGHLKVVVAALAGDQVAGVQVGEACVGARPRGEVVHRHRAADGVGHARGQALEARLVGGGAPGEGHGAGVGPLPNVCRGEGGQGGRRSECRRRQGAAPLAAPPAGHMGAAPPSQRHAHVWNRPASGWPALEQIGAPLASVPVWM